MEIFTNTFPVLATFENLDMSENLQMAKKALNGLSGIYAFVNIETGASYIGSSIDLGGRIMDHIDNSSNPHLHNAILKYGLSLYAFVILEYCRSSDLIEREQHFLDLLYTLPKTLIYNLLQIAGSSLGYKHTEDARAKMSELKLGDNNPIHGRTGENHPNAMTVNVYSLDNVLVHSFPSQTAAANWLKIPRTTFRDYLNSGKVWNKLYTFIKESSSLRPPPSPSFLRSHPPFFLILLWLWGVAPQERGHSLLLSILSTKLLKTRHNPPCDKGIIWD